ncbi:hypothetical protein [Streptomyces sp. SP18CS02]|uniref:hypothetical protein n=1 Tax=Streptomyces sp. SP18CS02 TaxID=3002531 RepID=UPI002E7A9407|nr:hypothetical protein [Streptomyces sp. SP18CS02]MEE1755768.1 hypothetical protein [Streptomyces sp. SP18CS02]
MVRNVLGAVLALTGATAAVLSPFRAWYDGRLGRHYRIADLLEGITATRAELFTSLLLPFLFTMVMTLAGLLLRSRLLVALAGLLVLGFTVVWMVRQGQAEGSLTVGSGGSGLGPGVALAAAGGVLLLLASALMTGHPRRGPERHGRRGEPDRARDGYQGYDGYEGYGPYPGADDTRYAGYRPEQDDGYRRDPRYGPPGDGHGHRPAPDDPWGPDRPYHPDQPHRTDPSYRPDDPRDRPGTDERR